MAGASEPENVFTKQQRIAQLARQSPEMSFTSLAYFIDIDWLREAYARVRTDAAPGVDGQTAADYAENLEANLRSLLERAKSGTGKDRCQIIFQPSIVQGNWRKDRCQGKIGVRSFFSPRLSRKDRCQIIFQPSIVQGN